MCDCPDFAGPFVEDQGFSSEYIFDIIFEIRCLYVCEFVSGLEDFLSWQFSSEHVS